MPDDTAEPSPPAGRRTIDILKTASSHCNIKLRDLAADLIAQLGKGAVATTHVDPRAFLPLPP